MMPRLRQPFFRFWMGWLGLLGVVFSSPEAQAALCPAIGTTLPPAETGGCPLNR
ncbi:MAG: hypothetical protein KDK97_00105 [Verrucomicrobiales bacterium]|nr:hypothetical protein [Verrucomicrobiales bacterium]MCP5557335.1 hypothetical protein [Verrucomicrobiaceae bacterium]